MRRSFWSLLVTHRSVSTPLALHRSFGSDAPALMCVVLCASALASCQPVLSAETIRRHPRLELDVLKPQIVDASANLPPAWTRSLQESEVSAVRFTGQSFSSSVDEAKSQAERDALAAISSFVAVEVESEFQASETHRERGGQVESETDISSVVRSRSNAELRGVKFEAFYWEKQIASPLTPENASYRYYVLARVPKSEITRARLKKQIDRQKQSGRQMLVVTPFRPLLAPSPLEASLGQVFIEEVSRRLGRIPGLHVSDPDLVRSMLAPGLGEGEVLEVISDTLLPDLIVTGSYQLHRDRLRATYSLYRGESVLKTGTVERGYADLFELEDELVEVLATTIASISPSLNQRSSSSSSSSASESSSWATADGQSAPPRGASDARTALRALEAYNAAYGHFERGDHLGALAKLEEARQLSPKDPRILLRLGRVLERLGRFGRIPSAARREPEEPWLPDHCTPWDQISKEPKAEFLRAAEGAVFSGEVPEWQENAENVDHVMAAIAFVEGGGYVPKIPGPEVPASAVGAYYHAFVLAREAEDLALMEEAELALGDLALRVDRLEAAEGLFKALLERARRREDMHVMSLSRFGLGKAAVAMGRHDLALEHLGRALDLRLILGEKPYILEILNELGGALVALGRYAEASQIYEKAQRVAADLGIDYLSAVLENNLGVLDVLMGHTARADERFARAFEVTQRLQDSEGQLSAGLNVSYLAAFKGDLERASAYLDVVRRLVQASRQEGRLAAFYNHRGVQAHRAGQAIDALRDVLRSWALFHRVSRSTEELRVRNNIAVADFSHLVAEASSDGRLDPREQHEIAGCSRTVFASILARGHKDDLESSAESIAEAQPDRARLVHLLTRMNGEVVRSLAP